MIQKRYRQLVQQLVETLRELYDMVLSPPLDFPDDPAFGDLSSPVALSLAKTQKQNPRVLAQQVAERIKKQDIDFLEDVQIAGAGYLNFTFKRGDHAAFLAEVYQQGEEFGRSNFGQGRKVNLEFVSANPTGPLHIAHGRQAAVGDTLARILSFSGYDVTREYYLNDCGNQVNLLARSMYSRYCELLGKSFPFPEEGYHGEYIREMAQEIVKRCKNRYLNLPEQEALTIFAKMGMDIIMSWIDKDLADFGVRFDVHYSQEKLEKGGRVEKVLELLRRGGRIYEKDGAQWLKAKEMGDQQDWVLVKGDGNYTYRTPDIAYHKDKFERGFDEVINLWGPDHHGHVGCMRAALKMLNPEWEKRFRVLLIQHCKLLRGGQEVKMSKRAATYVTLRELLEEVGRDAARYFFVMRKSDSHLDFDIEVAKKQSMENPVYYCQYAHARIESIFRKGEERGFETRETLAKLDPKDIAASLGDEERLLVRWLFRFPFVLEGAAENLDPERLTRYVHSLAGAIQSYYQKGDKDQRYRVLVEEVAVRRMRLFTIGAAQQVLRNALTLLGVSAPSQMMRTEGAS